MRTLTPLLCGSLILGFALSVSATILHVPSEYPTIQAGIDAAVDGDTVLVAPGTYTGAGNKYLDFGGRAILVASEEGPEATIIDCLGSGRGFNFHSGEGPASVVRGFTIKGGDVSSGGGIRCVGSSPTIVDNVITENSAHGGGGIALGSCSPTIRDNTITWNSGGWYGGGIECWVECYPLIIGNTIGQNDALSGGGIYCRTSSPTIRDNTIIENFGYNGGGIYCYDGSSPTIDGNAIITNASGPRGGGILCWMSSSPLIRGNTIVGNETAAEAISGSRGRGCAYSDSIEYAQRDWADEGPDQPGGGGGIACYYHSSPIMVGNLIARNRAIPGGGGIFGYSNWFSIIAGNTIVGNTASHNGGGIASEHGSAPVVLNCILWSDSAGWTGAEISVEDESEIDVSYSDVEGGSTAVFVGTGCTLNWGQGNIDADPLFVTGPHGDYYLSQIAAGQPQQSPCVDLGHPDRMTPGGTTRTDEECDLWPADIGYHYPWPGGPGPSLSIQVIPDTTQISPGEELCFEVDIVNLTECTLYFQAWLDGFLPNGDPYAGNPVLKPIWVIFEADSAVYGHRRCHPVPSQAPCGEPYKVCVRAGTLYPDSIWAEDCFEFAIVPPPVE